MMKKAKVFLCSLLVLCAVFFCMTALAAEDIVFTFENEASCRMVNVLSAL